MGATDIPSNADTTDASTNGVVGRLGGITNALQPTNARLSALLNGFTAQPPPVNDRPTLRASVDQVQQQISAAQATVTELYRFLGT